MTVERVMNISSRSFRRHIGMGYTRDHPTRNMLYGQRQQRRVQSRCVADFLSRQRSAVFLETATRSWHSRHSRATTARRCDTLVHPARYTRPCPGVNPADYRNWSVTQEYVYQVPIRDAYTVAAEAR